STYSGSLDGIHSVGTLRITFCEPRYCGRDGRGLALSPGSSRARRTGVKKNGRARRVPLPLLLRYRSVDDSQWHEGRVENISRSGVLFSTPDVLDVDTELEMTFELPVPP